MFPGRDLPARPPQLRGADPAAGRLPGPRDGHPRRHREVRRAGLHHRRIARQGGQDQGVQG